jgi:hypothetical protein
VTIQADRLVVWFMGEPPPAHHVNPGITIQAIANFSDCGAGRSTDRRVMGAICG